MRLILHRYVIVRCSLFFHQVDRVIPVAGKEQMSEFGHLFRERASKNLSDGHLWFSVVARPPQSRFTRTQRVCCCLCLLFMTMLANAMFYQQASSSANAYTFGPFALTPEQVGHQSIDAQGLSHKAPRKQTARLRLQKFQKTNKLN